ncbi:MAG: hypothetical protein COU07_03790 [Candidatus Harrisonbacteria bacterium CG10_big_fil_rev_8_21_14_0_10_40_38]|uniref:TrbL/VirB6 plasmid conjugal transfer protein n=1 Tax=Candidatus Harrisonbacteria bacterium CG10_big_fil_rev_8_21_14_0_10_40_38 TaxID=1974583 RepID=A0A2H0URF8_9BACT|nr:MAG: hypothetical protein COU07_03790 [Candidatus Harrisonbacteria bacterium CG10_big_fil_rev_8_21_14_0_10_40_38]
MKRRNKKFLIGALTGLAIGILLVSPIYAQEVPEPPQGPQTQEEAVDGCGSYLDLGCYLAGFLNDAALQILNWIFYIVGVFISFSGGIINTLVIMSGQLMTLEVVREGFRILLTFSNLGFVLAIIFVAFSTILRTSGYETKTFLYRLIVAAVLVNFSFAIAGAIIDFNNVIGFFFIQKSDPDNIGDLATGLAASFNPQQLLQVKDTSNLGLVGNFKQFGAAFFSVLVSLGLSVVFATLIAVIFFGVALMFLIRLLVLTALIIVMPLVWLAWIVPAMNKYWSQWWNTFLRWNFFLPAVTFFLYLGILTAESTDIFVKTAAIGSESALAIDNNILQQSGFGGLIAMLIKIGIFAMALWAGNAMGIAGSKGALATATNIKNRVLGGVTGTIKGVALAPAKAGKAIGEKYVAKPLGRGIADRTARLLTLPGIRTIPGAKVAASKLTEKTSRKAEIEEYQKNNFDNLTNRDFVKVQNTGKGIFNTMSNIQKVALLNASIKRGELSGLTKGLPESEKGDRLREFINAVKSTNPGTEAKDIKEVKDILSANPHLAPELMPNQKDDKGNVLSKSEVISKQVKKIKPEKITDVDSDAFKDKDVVLSLSPSQIGAVYSRGSTGQIEKMQQALENLLGSKLKDISSEIAKTQSEIKEAKAVNDKTRVSALQTTLKGHFTNRDKEISGATQEQKDAFKQYQVLSQRIINPSSQP